MAPQGMESGFLRERIRDLLDGELTAETREALKALFKDVRPEDIAEALADLTPEETVQVFEVMPDEVKPEVLDETDGRSKEEIIEGLPADTLQPVLEAMPPDEATDLLEMMPADQQAKVLGDLEPAKAQEVRKLLHHDAESAGGIMTSEFVSVRRSMTAREIRRLIEEHAQLEVISYVYVVNDEGRLVGVLSIRDVLASKAETRAEEMMEADVIAARVDEDQEEVANLARKYNLNSIPIVDHNQRLVGVATIDDIVDVIHEEADEDIYRLAGTSGDHPTQRKIIVRFVERVRWLAISVAAGLAVGYWQVKVSGDVVAELALLPWTPLVMGVSGAAGIQVATLLTRGIATGEIDMSRTLRVVGQELTIGGLIAITYGLVAWALLALALTTGWFQIDGRVPFAVAIGLVVGILIATSSGTLLPPLCKSLGIDPALVSGPFITALNDFVASLVYLSIGAAMLSA